MVYWMSGQPMEFHRMTQYLIMCLLVSLVSESLGLTIGSTLGIVVRLVLLINFFNLKSREFFQNGMFMGPVLSVPLMLLSSYGMGWGDEPVPALIRLAMNFSYLRYGLEGIIVTIYGLDRETLPCSTDYCHLREPKSLLKHVRSFFPLNQFLYKKFCFTGGDGKRAVLAGRGSAHHHLHRPEACYFWSS
jgi:hypothetical protein